jgi:hypothetical protein
MSTARLLITLAVAVAAVAVAGIAFARGSNDKPPPKPLSSAIAGALGGQLPKGVTADITFTNNLLPSGALGNDQSLSGATGKLWVSDSGRFRLDVKSGSHEAKITGGPSGIQVYDPKTDTVYRLPVSGAPKPTGDANMGGLPMTGSIANAISQLSSVAHVTGATPTTIAGQPAYSVRVEPLHDGGLLGGVEIGWDAAHAIPLKVAVYSRGQSEPVLALTATDVAYGQVPDAQLTVPGADSAHVVDLKLPNASSFEGVHPTVSSGAKGAGFKVSAPDTLVGLPRQSVRVISAGDHKVALVVYGRGLGAVAVVEQAAEARNHEAEGLSHLPAVSIDGAPGHELATALGTIVRFQKGDVTYTVIGSVPPVAAEAAARAVS